MTSNLEAALHYAGLGWKVFPVNYIRNDGSCSCGAAKCDKSPGKHPLTFSGHKEATTNAQQITSWWEQYPLANIGIATGNVVVIDVDVRADKSGVRGIDQYEHNLREIMPDTLYSETGSGGYHFFFWKPEGFADQIITTNSTTLDGRRLYGIDIRGDGGYAIVPPSNHISGGSYQWMDVEALQIEHGDLAVLPETLIQRMALRKTKAQQPIMPALPVAWYDDRDLAKIEDALTAIPADSDHGHWLDVSMALHYTCRQEAFELWDQWSRTSPDSYDYGRNLNRWNSFSIKRDNTKKPETIYMIARQYGWEEKTVRPWTFVDKNGEVIASQDEDGTLYQRPRTEEDPEPEEPTTEQDEQEEVIEGERRLGAPPFPMDLIHNLEESSVLYHIHQYIVGSARRPQPVLAMLAAITVVALLTNRRFRLQYGGRMNLMGVALGETGSGKDHGRVAIKEICRALEATNFLGGEQIASGQGLVSRMAIDPNCIFQLDEFGLMLQACTSGKDQHKADIVTTLMRLFSSADTVVRGTEYANKREKVREDLIHPHVFVHGTSTPDQFWQALSAGHASNGFLGRFLVVATDELYPTWNENQKPLDQVPPEIRYWYNRLNGAVTRSHTVFGVNTSEVDGEGGARPNTGADNQYEITLTDAARSLRNRFEGEFVIPIMRDASDKTRRAVFGRVMEYAIKLAGIHAVARSPETPEIDEQDLMWGIQFAKHSCDLIYYHTQASMADSWHEGKLKECLNIFRQYGTAGLGRAQLGKEKGFLKWKKREREEMIEQLLESGNLKLVGEMPRADGKPGRPRRNVLVVSEFA